MPEKAFLAATGPDRKNNGANLTDDGKYPKVIFKYPPDHFFNFHNVKILFYTKEKIPLFKNNTYTE